MRIGTLLAALLALSSWTFAVSGKAMAHGGTDLAVLDCEDEEGDESSRVFECDGDEESDETERAVLDCEDEDDGDSSRAVLDCHDDEEDQE